MFVMDSNAPFLRGILHRKIVVFMTCFAGFLLGLPMVTQAGIYFFQLVDHHSSIVTLVFIAFFEVIAVCWLYGIPLLSRNVQEMTGKKPALLFRVCWYFVSPCLVLIILVFSLIRYEPVHYGGYTYPSWAVVLGWLITIFCIIWIPLGIIHTLATSSGTPWQVKMGWGIIHTLATSSGTPWQVKMQTESRLAVIFVILSVCIYVHHLNNDLLNQTPPPPHVPYLKLKMTYYTLSSLVCFSLPLLAVYILIMCLLVFRAQN
uniref:Uncharacterized protein n=1 Tax=Eptatretus burgeri TaxID=7764 RepID=A0A8C4NI48_EPTBU